MLNNTIMHILCAHNAVGKRAHCTSTTWRADLIMLILRGGHAASEQLLVYTPLEHTGETCDLCALM